MPLPAPRSSGGNSIFDRLRRKSVHLKDLNISSPVVISDKEIVIVGSSASSFTESSSSSTSCNTSEKGIEYIKPKKSSNILGGGKKKKVKRQQPVVTERYTSLYTDELEDGQYPGPVNCCEETLEPPKPSFYGLSSFNRSFNELKSTNNSTTSLSSKISTSFKNSSTFSLLRKKDKKESKGNINSNSTIIPRDSTARPAVGGAGNRQYQYNPNYNSSIDLNSNNRYSTFSTFSLDQDQDYYLQPPRPNYISRPYGFEQVSSSVTSFSQFNNNNYNQSSLDLYSEPYLRLSPRACQSSTSLRSELKKGYRKSVDYTGMMSEGSYTFREVGEASGSRNENGEHRWSTGHQYSDYESDDMSAPPIPAKSTLRSNNASRSNTNLLSNPSQNGSSSRLPRSYIISGDAAPTPSPSGSSRSSSENGDRSIRNNQPFTPNPAISTFPNTDISTFAGNKNRTNKRGLSLSGDPYKIRDGQLPKESASGVYTPPTFTAASRSNSSQTTIQSPVSHMTSHSLPNSPNSTSTRWFGSISTAASGAYSAVSSYSFSSANKTKSHSHHQPSRSISSSSTTSSTSSYLYTPVSSAREAYFPSVPGPTISGPVKVLQSPVALYSPTMTQHSEIPSSRPRPISTLSTNSIVMSDVPKGKRKPVPKVKEVQDALDKLNVQDEVDEQLVHAI